MRRTVPGPPRDFWIQDVSAAAENVLLAAVELGLGGVWIGVHPIGLFSKGVSEVLDLPKHIEPLGLLWLGHPAESPRAANAVQRRIRTLAALQGRSRCRWHPRDLTPKGCCVIVSLVIVAPSSSGLGHSPFKAAAGIRIPVGLPRKEPGICLALFVYMTILRCYQERSTSVCPYYRQQ